MCLDPRHRGEDDEGGKGLIRRRIPSPTFDPKRFSRNFARLSDTPLKPAHTSPCPAAREGCRPATCGRWGRCSGGGVSIRPRRLDRGAWSRTPLRIRVWVQARKPEPSGDRPSPADPPAGGLFDDGVKHRLLVDPPSQSLVRSASGEIGSGLGPGSDFARHPDFVETVLTTLTHRAKARRSAALPLNFRRSTP